MAEATFKGRCGGCDHVWTIAYLPMSVTDWARLAKAARCPKGCKDKVFCA